MKYQFVFIKFYYEISISTKTTSILKHTMLVIHKYRITSDCKRNRSILSNIKTANGGFVAVSIY